MTTKDPPLSAAEDAIAERIGRCTSMLVDVLRRENNARVFSCAILTLLEHNPELSVMFEALCQHMAVAHVIKEARLTKARRQELGRI